MGTFPGTFFQQVDSTGKIVGNAISAKDVFVALTCRRLLERVFVSRM